MKDLSMSRASKSSSTIEVFASAAATLAAMTAYNVYRARKAEREHPPAGQFVTVDGVRLHYIERGEGPRSFCFTVTWSRPRISILAGCSTLVAQRHRVIAFDRPGFGYSDRPHGSAWSAGTQADLIRDAFAVLGINRPIVLGHSWGAAVALALGVNHPNAVRGLVLLSGYYYPTLRADVLFSAPTAIPILGDLLRYSVSPFIGRAMLPLLLKGMFAPLPVPPRFTKRFPRGMSVRPGQIRAEKSRRRRDGPGRPVHAASL